MNHVFAVQEKNINGVVELYKKIINEIIAINPNPTTSDVIFLNLKI